VCIYSAGERGEGGMEGRRERVKVEGKDVRTEGGMEGR